MGWSEEEKKTLPPSYECNLLVEKATEEQIQSKDYPRDAYIVKYFSENELVSDICRGKIVNIFNLYYDKFGPNVIQKIEWGNGTINPKLWGYKNKEDKQRKK